VSIICEQITNTGPIVHNYYFSDAHGNSVQVSEQDSCFYFLYAGCDTRHHLQGGGMSSGVCCGCTHKDISE